jgi:hypothetical protein
MAISGHATMKEVTRYTKMADKAHLGRNAMAKVVKASLPRTEDEPKLSG